MVLDMEGRFSRSVPPCQRGAALYRVRAYAMQVLLVSW